MRRLTDADGLSDVQRDILRIVRDFVDAEVLPVAAELDRTDTYPDKIVERLKELGVFGLTISEEYGGLGESLLSMSEKDPGFGETRPGLTVPGKIHKMGYKGVDTTELILDECRVPASRVLGGGDKAGRGFYQLMDGIEVGRVNVAARGCGVAHRAFELAVSYARSRRTFGKIIGEHQAVSFKLAEMATKTVAAHQMMVLAARRKDEGGQTDV